MQIGSTPTVVVTIHRADTTPVGVDAFGIDRPRVARSWQPWALLRNPLGFQELLTKLWVMLSPLEEAGERRRSLSIRVYFPFIQV